MIDRSRLTETLDQSFLIQSKNSSHWFEPASEQLHFPAFFFSFLTLNMKHVNKVNSHYWNTHAENREDPIKPSNSSEGLRYLSKSNCAYITADMPQLSWKLRMHVVQEDLQTPAHPQTA